MSSICILGLTEPQIAYAGMCLSISVRTSSRATHRRSDLDLVIHITSISFRHHSIPRPTYNYIVRVLNPWSLHFFDANLYIRTLSNDIDIAYDWEHTSNAFLYTTAFIDMVVVAGKKDTWKYAGAKLRSHQNLPPAVISLAIITCC